MSDPPKPTLEELYPLPDPAVIEANRKKRQERQRARWKLEAERRARAKIPVPHLGVAAYFSKPVFANEVTIDRLARLFVDPRWPWLPWWASYSAPDPRNDSKAIRVGGKNGYSPIVEALRRRDLHALRLNRTHGENNNCSAEIDLHKLNAERETSYPLWLICKATDLPADKSIDDFLALTHEILEVVGAATAVIGAWPTHNYAICDVSFLRMVLDTPKGDINLGLTGDFARQRDLGSSVRYQLGRAYARFPRWGTYLHAGHLAAIGGLERVRAVVDPAVVQRVGALTYLQLTPSVDTAQSPEAEAKRRALEELMAPILPSTTEPSTAP
jgi:hypothetical protein